MKTRTTAILAASALLFGLTACSAEEPPPVTTQSAESEAEAEAPAAEPEPEEAQKGTRENPLNPGEGRKFSEDSAFAVTFGKTEFHDGYLAVPVTVDIDWDAYNEQAKVNGDPQDGPVDPFVWTFYKYMSKGGETFDMMDNYNVDMADSIHMVGEVYAPKKQVKGTYYVSVPNDQAKGGMWVTENWSDDRIFTKAVAK